MAKLKKTDLEHFTETAALIAGRALSLLFLTQCPVEQEFLSVDAFVKEIKTIRQELGLGDIDPEIIFRGERPKHREPIGFQLPEVS